ncbi:MAG: hypothetical protein NT144_08195 [Bacteroidia bacterium]|nr:hypothetical protein [Bacteroidia bacterium]
MKKIIIGLSGLLIVAFVVIIVANAQNSTQGAKKASTEMSKDCGKCPSASACGKMTEATAADVKKCDPAKCKEMGCDPAKCKEGKCDPAKCKANCANSKDGMKKCDPAMCKGFAKK